MSRSMVLVLYVVVMVVAIVGADFLVFRDYFWARLAANVGIVLLFAAVYLRFVART